MCDRDQKPEFKSISYWLLIAAFSLVFITRHALAADETQTAAKETSVSVNANRPGFPARITTLDGKTYEKVILEKVDPDGLLVLFAPAGGGLGTAKLKFRNLPAELREQFAYDPVRASDYEAAQARGEAIWLAESAVWTEQRRAAQAEQAARERQLLAEAESRRAAEAEQAQMEAMRYMQEPAYYYYPGWWWSDDCDSISHHHHRGGGRFHHNNHASRRLPAAGLTRSPLSQNISPMRPNISPMRPSGK